MTSAIASIDGQRYPVAAALGTITDVGGTRWRIRFCTEGIAKLFCIRLGEAVEIGFIFNGCADNRCFATIEDADEFSNSVTFRLARCEED